MFKKFWCAARWFLLAGSIFVAGMVSAMFFTHPFKDIGDLATWIGAVGTIGTLIGAMWLATEQHRIDHDRALRRAYVIAVALTPQLEIVQVRLNHLTTLMMFDSEYEYPSASATAKPIVEVMVPQISSDDLGALTALKGDVAFRLGRAINLFRLAQSTIEADLVLIRSGADLLHPSTAKLWRERIEIPTEMFRVVHREFRELADKYASRPDGSELWGDIYER